MSINSERASVSSDYAKGDAQTQPRSLANFFCCEKWLGDFIDYIFRNTATAVCNKNNTVRRHLSDFDLHPLSFASNGSVTSVSFLSRPQ